MYCGMWRIFIFDRRAGREDGKHYPMVGALPGKGIKKGRLTRFGYIELTAEMNGVYIEKGREDPGA